MQTVETQNEGLKRAYKLTITAADIEARVDDEVKKIAPQVQMPGFRPGKVPANLVKKMHKDQLHQDALNSTIQNAVQSTIEDNKLRPATQPDVRLGEGYEQGKDAEVDFNFEILPQIDAPEIKDLKLERLQVEATDKEVTAAIEKLAAGQKSFDTAKKDKKAEKGDQVIIDFEGKVDGVPFEGGKGESMAVEIGSGQLIPGFEDQLIGMKANDERVIKVTFPADYQAEDLKGQDATFDIVCGEVKTPSDTKIDDDMAKNFGLDGLDKLKELMKGQVEQELNGLTRTHMKRQLLDTLAADHDFEVPPSMAEAEFEQIWTQLEKEAQGEDDPEAAREDMESDKDEYRDIAERRVRLGLLLSEIGQANGVEINQQEMNMLVQQAAQQYPQEQQQAFVNYLQENPMAAAQLRAPMFEDKVVDYLFEQADITDKKVSREELEKAIEEEPEAKPAKKKPAAKKAATKKSADEKAADKKSGDTKAPAKKAAAKKSAENKDAEKKAPAKKAAPKKAAPKKAAAKKK